MRFLVPAALVVLPVGLLAPAHGAEPAKLKVEQTDAVIRIDTDALQASIPKKVYVSGIQKGTFLDKKTGARELGFGLHIMDFLMAPGWRDDGYSRDPKIHGNLPKHWTLSGIRHKMNA